MRKTMFWSSLIASLLLGGACKKDPTEKAEDQVRKSVEEVREQREDLREAQKDVVEEQKELTEEQKELMKQQRELEAAKGQAAQAHANYIAALRDRLAKVDMKIRELEARTDAKSKDAAIALKARRDQLKTRIDTTGAETEAQWEEFKDDTGKVIDELEKDLDKHLDTDY